MHFETNNHLKNKCLTIGIIGAGDIVSKVHLPVLLETKGVTVGWITDVNKTKTKALANAYKISYFELKENITNLPKSDIVLLAIPFGVRDPYYKILKEHSSALYVEKPFARSVKYHKEICSWFPPHALCCGFQRRAWGPTQIVKKIIDDNVFGPVKLIRFGLGRPGDPIGGKHYSDIKLAGGGILFEVGVHGIDTILYCTSAKAIQVNSSTMLLDNELDIHTEAELIIKTKNDQNINCEIKVSRLEETINQIEFIFEHAILSYSLFSQSGEIRVKPTNGNKSVLSITLDKERKVYPLSTYQTFSDYWNKFIEGIYTKKSNFTSANDSILTTEIIEELYKRGVKN